MQSFARHDGFNPLTNSYAIVVEQLLTKMEDIVSAAKRHAASCKAEVGSSETSFVLFVHPSETPDLWNRS